MAMKQRKGCGTYNPKFQQKTCRTKATQMETKRRKSARGAEQAAITVHGHTARIIGLKVDAHRRHKGANPFLLSCVSSYSEGKANYFSSKRTITN